MTGKHNRSESKRRNPLFPQHCYTATVYRTGDLSEAFYQRTLAWKMLRLCIGRPFKQFDLVQDGVYGRSRDFGKQLPASFGGDSHKRTAFCLAHPIYAVRHSVAHGESVRRINRTFRPLMQRLVPNAVMTAALAQDLCKICARFVQDLCRNHAVPVGNKENF